MYDTLQQINQMQLLGASLVISKIYASVAAMEADSAPVSDLSGNALKEGQLVVIVPSDTSSSDLGSVYRYDGTTDGVSSWSFVGKIGGYPMDETPTEGSTRAVTSGGVYSEVSQLAQEVDDLDAIVDDVIEHSTSPSPNLFNKATIHQGYAVSKNTGTLFAEENTAASDYIEIPSGAASIYLTTLRAYGSAGWAVYDAAKAFVRGGNNTNQISVQNGDAYIRFSLLASNVDSAMVIVGTSSDVPGQYVPYGDITHAELKDNVVTTPKIAESAITAPKIAPDAVTKDKADFIIKTCHASKNLLNPSECVNGYIRYTNGTFGGGSSTPRYATGFIPVDAAGIYVNCFNAYGTNAGWAVYDANKNYIRGAAQDPNSAYIYQSGDAFIRLTINISGLGSSYYVVKATDPHAYTPYFEPYYTYSLSDEIDVPAPETIPAYEPALSLAGKVGTKGTGDTLSNDTITLDGYPQYIKRCFNLSAVGKITTFGQLDLGVGKGTQNGTFIRVDGTNVYFCRYYQGNVHYLFTQAHGLTITDFVDVSVYMNDGEMTAMVATLGGVFKYTFTRQIDMECYGTPFVTADENTSLTGFSFRAAGVRFRLPVWVVGDSYCSWYGERWPKQLSTSFDVTDFLLDGLAGGGSGTMFAEFQKMLNYGTPKFLIWCLGMNDTFNDWNGIYTMLKELCEEKGITLVLQTIPWPENNASEAAQKDLINAEIKASGLRYFDGYAAVSSDENGTWYTGYCADGVHTTTEGAKAMAARFLVDFPEILQ